jgi:putative acetyltransferase
VKTFPHPAIELLQPSSPDQVEEVRQLFREYAESLDFSLCFQGFDEELRTLPGAYSRPGGRLLLAQCEGRSAGCIALRQIENGICEMKRLYVRPVYRGKRIGELLVDSIITEARAIGYQRMRLDTISSSMQNAIALYRRKGFREIEPYRDNPIAGVLYLELLL